MIQQYLAKQTLFAKKVSRYNYYLTNVLDTGTLNYFQKVSRYRYI